MIQRYYVDIFEKQIIASPEHARILLLHCTMSVQSLIECLYTLNIWQQIYNKNTNHIVVLT